MALATVEMGVEHDDHPPYHVGFNLDRGSKSRISRLRLCRSLPGHPANTWGEPGEQQRGGGSITYSLFITSLLFLTTSLFLLPPPHHAPLPPPSTRCIGTYLGKKLGSSRRQRSDPYLGRSRGNLTRRRLLGKSYTSLSIVCVVNDADAGPSVHLVKSSSAVRSAFTSTRVCSC